ncbi:hypothetical protein J5N97_000668 [Dioscorea zingiberensis]|uniref:ABC transporter domain-containing protein n=1 Tax=Dioscorea zingiberensis TaxID=325984 RepID=A0A9D5BS22_9LILI|nr:hypothetical protein J5N97_000668 [Dioscorea zingiberensis]
MSWLGERPEDTLMETLTYPVTPRNKKHLLASQAIVNKATFTLPMSQSMSLFYSLHGLTPAEVMRKQERGALVGLPGVNGLSTEQRKRLTIAVELVANPSIIFMDEPTSGLDARAAAIVMRTVRNTVDTGRTVLFLMKRGGEEIYVGPLGRNSSHLIQGISGVRKIKDGYNPATWMLEVTSLAQEEVLGVNFAELYKIPIYTGETKL